MSSPELPRTQLTVKPEWIDHNGHMNVAYYVLAFDEATDTVYDTWGLGLTYPERGFSVFTLGMNVDYLRELFAGDAIHVTTQLMDWDHKRVHYIHQMYHDASGELAATNECLAMNIDLQSRRSASFPEDIQTTLQAVFNHHRQIPLPASASRVLKIARK